MLETTFQDPHFHLHCSCQHHSGSRWRQWTLSDPPLTWLSHMWTGVVLYLGKNHLLLVSLPPHWLFFPAYTSWFPHPQCSHSILDLYVGSFQIHAFCVIPSCELQTACFCQWYSRSIPNTFFAKSLHRYQWPTQSSFLSSNINMWCNPCPVPEDMHTYFWPPLRKLCWVCSFLSFPNM